ncbi:MAG: PAS domain S-box protein [Cyclobacteriaceae bacterium]|nr:PAS domain S-box protein [Cyclobacteriaceae bacterium]
MHRQINEIVSLEELFELHGSIHTIGYHGKQMTVEWWPEYHSDQTLYQSRNALVDGNILIISSYGSPNPYDIRKAADLLEKFHVENQINDVHVIWDVRNLENPGIRVRKGIVECNNRLEKYWKSRYLVISPKYKTLIRIYQFIYQGKVENLFFSQSIEEATNRILSQTPPEAGIDYSPDWTVTDRISLSLKSKEELIDIIEHYKKNHTDSTNKVLEAIGQISWEGKFKKVEIEVDDDDPHFELINAFSLLQQDVAEIIKEYKELNQNLELKVAERIVDFIDKESNLRAILDNSDRVTWLMNNRLEIIDFNAAFSNEVSRRYGKIPRIHQNLLELITNEKVQEEWKARFESALKGKPGIYLEQDNFDNQERVWEIKTFPIREIGKIKGVSVFIEDITQLKNSQFKLIEKNRDLQKVNNELDSFVYRVSHDLRAPLTSILGLISLMKMETDHDKIADYITLQEKSIQKLDLFIKEIINLSRNSRLGITVSRIDFRDLLDEIFEGQHYTKAAERVERICDIEEELQFYTDRQRLSIILNNLISNSLKYSNGNQPEPFVKVKVFMESDQCVIEVSDNGIGISEMYLPKIFEMFFRATQEFSGSGLGLYIVKETVEKLKGKIKVKSKMRQGTCFRVSLPNLKNRYDAAPKLED